MSRTIFTRRSFLKTMGLGAGALVLPSAAVSAMDAAKVRKKPNIVWIMAEDICPDLRCYGTPAVETANLDRLAGQGVRFTNAFVTAPVCSPSKSALLTGMQQISIGAHNHRTINKKPLPSPVKPFTDYLRQAGYFNAAGCGFPYSDDLNFEYSNLYDGNDWSQRGAGQPFFARIKLSVTHRPFQRDSKNPIDPKKVNIPPYYPDTPLVRRDWADYLESIQIMDRQVGDILKRLDNEGLCENTVVIFSGDHGRCHVRGKQWLYDGGLHIPLIIRWPGKLSPGRVCDDLISAIDISATILSIAGVDVPAYMHGRPFLGDNVVKRDAVFAARDRCDAVVDRIRCVRTKKFKYIRNFRSDVAYTTFGHYKEFQYPVLHVLREYHKQGKLTPAQTAFMAKQKPVEELYDIRKDPYEINNLADDPKYAAVLAKLRARLNKWLKDTNDLGSVPESEEFLAKLGKMREEKYAHQWKQRGINPHAAPAIHLLWWKKHLGVQ
jgi:N-sulfoglucosamine sulfohydrolase